MPQSLGKRFLRATVVTRPPPRGFVASQEAPAMAKRRRPRQPERVQLPFAQQVLGVVVESLDLRDFDVSGRLASRTSSEFFDGARVKNDTRAEILRAAAAAFLRADFVELPAMPDPALGFAQEALARMVSAVAETWDAAVGGVGHVRVRATLGNVLKAVAMRLATIDGSLRLGAVCLMSARQPPASGAPAWARPGARAGILTSLLDECAAERRPSRLALAKKCKVEPNAVHDWFSPTRPRRPGRGALEHLAAVFADAIPGTSATQLLRRLRSQYALCDLATRLRDAVGDPGAVEDCGERLLAYSNQVFAHLAKEGVPQPLLGEIFVLGAGHPLAADICAVLREQESNRFWQTDLAAAHIPWSRRLEHVANDLAQMDDPATMERLLARVRPEHRDEFREFAAHVGPLAAQVDMSLPPSKADAEKYPYSFEWRPPAPIVAANRLAQAAYNLERGDLDRALAHARRAIEVQPLDADAHSRYGGMLNRVGNFDRAEEELLIAINLKPGWEEPLRELGIILMNRGRPAESRAFFEKHADDLPSLSADWHYWYGIALMKCAEYALAAAAFEKMLAAQPEHAVALDCTAHCYLMVGNRLRGAELAKQAEQRGATYSYVRWKEGGYPAQ